MTCTLYRATHVLRMRHMVTRQLNVDDALLSRNDADADDDYDEDDDD